MPLAFAFDAPYLPFLAGLADAWYNGSLCILQTAKRLAQPETRHKRRIDPMPDVSSRRRTRAAWLGTLLGIAEDSASRRFNSRMIAAIVAASVAMSVALTLLVQLAIDGAINAGLLVQIAATAFLTSLVIGTLGVWFADALVHRIKAMREDLRVALAQAELASRAKSEFLANMSHEIRTPLNGVLGMAQVLETTSLTSEQREHLHTIRESGDLLIAIIDDVLDLAKIEAGKTDLRRETSRLASVLEGSVALFAARAAERGTCLTFRCEGDPPARAVYDSVRVRQCLANLVSNAVKFTTGGEVSVTLSACPLDDGDWLVTLAVRDTGIGISAEAQDALFQSFTQVASATPGEFGGTGLGLAISRRLARMMGGDITVESAPGLGATFRFTFVAGAAGAETAGSATGDDGALPGLPDVVDLTGVRLLVVDDSAVNRRVVTGMLGPLGAICIQAESGRAALDALAGVDLVLLDMHMPGMDGAATLRAIRALPEPAGAIPVIALTADVTSAWREHYLALGMQGYVPKPVRRAALCAEIAAVLPSVPGGASRAGSAISPA